MNSNVEISQNSLKRNITQPFSLYAMFKHAKYLRNSKSLEYVPFLFWLIQAQKPEFVVQLGAKTGTSYFALCQALENTVPHADAFLIMNNSNLDKNCENRILSYNEENYFEFSTIINGNYDESNLLFNNEEIDLLFFNHNIENMVEMYEQWKPKLKEDALVVITGIERTSNSNKSAYELFLKLKREENFIEFILADGIAIVSPEKIKNGVLENIFSIPKTKFRLKLIQNAFIRLGEACKYKFYNSTQKNVISDLKKELKNREAEYTRLDKFLEDLKLSSDLKQNKIEDLQKLLESRENELRTVNVVSEEKQKIFETLNAELKKEIAEKNVIYNKELDIKKEVIEKNKNESIKLRESIEEKNRLLDEKNNKIKLLSDDLNNVNLALKERAEHAERINIDTKAKISERFEEIAKLTNELIQRDTELEQVKLNYNQLGNSLKVKDKSIADKDVKLASLNKKYLELENSLKAKDKLIADKDVKLASLNKKYLELENSLKAKDKLIADKDVKLEDLNKKYLELENSLKAKDKLIADKDVKLEDLNKKYLELDSRLKDLKKQFSLTDNDYKKNIKNRFSELSSLTNILISRDKDIAVLNEEISSLKRMPLKSKIDRREKKKLNKQSRIIKKSMLFDTEWYLKQNPDVAKENMEPIKHYLKFGAKENRNPSLKFNTEWYLKTYPDVVETDMNPLIHYIKYGKKEGRLPKEGSII